jgi:hypothetical protein
VLECVLEARDSAGQVSRSAPLRVLVGPSNRIDVQGISSGPTDGREWRTSRQAADDARSWPVREEGPEIYRDALRAYFKALDAPASTDGG